MKSQESKSSNFYNIQSPFCVDQLIIAVASLVLHNIWRSDQSDSTPDIPGKILLPGPRKSPRSRRGGVVWGRDRLPVPGGYRGVAYSGLHTEQCYAVRGLRNLGRKLFVLGHLA